jgi:ABC transporter substrate binding protein (PQQ-dependent alcohol dehydrogenase system)
MRAAKRLRLAFAGAALAASVGITPAAAQQSPAPGASAPATLRIGYVRYRVEPYFPHSFMEVPPKDDGIAGARVGIGDDNTTGRFMGQQFVLDEKPVEDAAALADAFRALIEAGDRLIVADVPAPQLLQLADLPEAKEATLFNVAAPDDSLRGEDCRANVLHMIPNDAMLTDALVQYLVAKRWRNILLVAGKSAADRAYAEAAKRSIRKFGAKLVAEKPWLHDPGAQRTDTGHYAIAAEVARFTQGLSYDVLLVADVESAFGDDLPFRTTDPRPVVGTAGLVPVAWARPHEQWGATQLQNRFRRAAGRWMSVRDYAAWMAVRAVGEAATRTRSTDAATIAKYLRGDSFDLAAFKGVKLTFRPWDGQLRQPILLADANSLVSVSPQPGFLHQYSELDTLGFDRPETKCRMASP